MGEITVKKGVVVAFNRETCMGEAEAGGRIVKFHSTSFGSSPARWPRIGDRVELIYQDARLIRVRTS
jgi:hypothetical protein